MTIPAILVSIWDRVSRIWVFFRNLWARNHILFLSFGWWLGIRFACYVWSRIFTHIYDAIQSVSSSVQTATQMGGGFTAWETLSICNAILPLQEALILGALLLTIKLALQVLNLVRYVYKQIPFKAS